MHGIITTRDVLANMGLIWREFGWRCLLRCLLALLASRPTTFLEVAFRLPPRLAGSAGRRRSTPGAGRLPGRP